MQAYVELDCLMDTRTATLKRYYPDKVISIVCDERYWKRPNDDLGEIFEGIDTKTFKEQYRTRDYDTLLLSTITEIPRKLRDVVLERKVITSTSDKPMVEGTLYINFYPYELPEALVEALILQFKIETGYDKIRKVFLAPKDVTPSFLHRMDPVIMYDIDEWLGHHVDELSNRPLPGQSFKVPLLVKRLPGTPEELTFNIGATQNILRAVMHYDPQPISMFCFDDPASKE